LENRNFYVNYKWLNRVQKNSWTFFVKLKDLLIDGNMRNMLLHLISMKHSDTGESRGGLLSVCAEKPLSLVFLDSDRMLICLVRHDQIFHLWSPFNKQWDERIAMANATAVHRHYHLVARMFCSRDNNKLLLLISHYAFHEFIDRPAWLLQECVMVLHIIMLHVWQLISCGLAVLLSELLLVR
jgi:hypothetical protein